MSFFRKKENQAMITVVLSAVIIISTAAVCFTGVKLPENIFGKSENFDVNGVYESLSNLENADIISNKKISVVLDKNMPQAIAYGYENGAYLLGAGNVPSSANYYIINGSEYVPSVSYEKIDKTTARYTVTVNEVTLTDEIKSNLKFVYEFSVNGNEMIKKLISLEGDSESAELWIQESNPVLQIDGQMPEPGIAASTTAFQTDTGNQMEEMIGTLDVLSNRRISNGSFSFVWNKGVSAAVYTPSAHYNPYQTEVINTASGKRGVIYAGRYYHRLADGVRLQREDTDGKVSDIFYELRIGFTDDCNETGSVDWQDAALWLRAEIPQMPQELRDFLSVGYWGQYHLAFPPGTEENLAAYTKVYGTYAQYLEVQRQLYNLTDGVAKASYEMVGWQGRGHDYGWPDLSEQPFNPALGDETTPVKYKDLFAKYGGDLSFHINTSDASEITSHLYLRDEDDKNPLGNISVVDKEDKSYESEVFGWNGYHILHYLDFIKGYSNNRQEAFVDKYFAPFIMYSDVMTDHTTSKYSTIEDEYGKARIMQHWRTLGINMATEVYSQEKYLNGLFMFNTSYGEVPSRIDSFMLAGNSQFVATRTFNTAAEDYVWGYLGAEGGSIASSQNTMAKAKLANAFKGPFLCMGVLGNAGILSYEESDEKIITNWGNNIKVEFDRSSQLLTVTQDGNVIALGGDMIFPVPGDDSRALIYCSVAREAEWMLPESMRDAKTVSLYRLTADGREFVDTLKVKKGTVTFKMEGSTSYVIENKKKGKSVSENLATHSVISASSKHENGTTADGVNLLSKIFTIPAEKAPTGNWKDTLLGLNDNMLDSAGGIKYEFPVRSYNTVDGDADTYWEPNADENFGETDLSDGEAYLEYKFTSGKKVSKVKIDEVSDTSSKVTSFEIRYMQDGKWETAYSGTEIPEDDITFDEITASRIRIVILGAKDSTPRIAEVGIYS